MTTTATTEEYITNDQLIAMGEGATYATTSPPEFTLAAAS